MVVLKKFKASTLMETLVATILIVVVFMLSSMIMNSLFTNTSIKDDDNVRQELLLLQYQVEYGTLPLPYHGEWENWEIEVLPNGENMTTGVSLTAIHTETQQEISYQMAYEE